MSHIKIKTQLKALLLSAVIFTYAPFEENKDQIMNITARIFQTIIPSLPPAFSQAFIRTPIDNLQAFRAHLGRIAEAFYSQAPADYLLSEAHLSSCTANLSTLKLLTTEDNALQSLFSNAILGIEEKRINTTKTLLAYLKYKESLYSLLSSPQKIEDLRAKSLKELALTIDALSTSDKELFYKLVGFNKDSVPNQVKQTNQQLFETVVNTQASKLFKEQGISVTITFDDVISTPKPKDAHEFQTLLTKIGFMSPEQHQLFLQHTKVAEVKLSELSWKKYVQALPENNPILEKILTAAILYTEGKSDTEKMNYQEKGLETK